MIITHTSPVAITDIHKNGMFGDCLFFSVDEYAMSKPEAVYEMFISEDQIVHVSELYCEDAIEHIMSALDVDYIAAERMLDGRDDAFDHGLDGEDSWFIQRKQGEVAKTMGFDACESLDEQGTVYIVSMSDKLDKLKRIK